MQAAIQTETLHEQLLRVNAELAAAGRSDSFYTSLAQSWARYGSLTERQEAALRKSLAGRAEREAKRATENAAVTSPIPTGRVTISGEIVSTKYVENDFGGSLKMLVRSEAGWKVWGTVPAAIAHLDELKGLRVTFTATVQPKEASFGFFSRPTNAKIEAQPEPFSNRPTASVQSQANGTEQQPVAAPAPVAPAPAAPPAAGRLADIIARARELEQENRPACWINATTCE